MPVRDHFRPPLDNVSSWEEVHDAQRDRTLVATIHCGHKKAEGEAP